MKIITTNDFHEMIDNMKRHQKEIKKLNKGLGKIINESVYSDFGGRLLDNYIDLISLIFNDKTEVITWFVFEKEFGKNDVTANIDGEEIRINTTQELFNYLSNKS